MMAAMLKCMPVRTVIYEGAPLHMVPELNELKCDGCCFADWLKTSKGCSHRKNINCNSDHTIAVRDLEQHQVDAVTYNLTRYLP